MSATSLGKNNTQVLSCTLGTIKEKQQPQKSLVLLCFQGIEVKKYLCPEKNQLQTHFETVSSCKCFKRQLHEFSKVNLCSYFTCLSCFYLRCESWPHRSAFRLSFWSAASDQYMQIQASAKDVRIVRLPVTIMAPNPHLKLAQHTWRNSFISVTHHSTTSVGLVANSGEKEKRTRARWQ